MNQDFLGVGIDLGPGSNKLGWALYEDPIRQSVLFILRTRKGERLMRPDFGCGLNDMPFSTISTSTVALIDHYIREALRKWEPRIKVEKVSAKAMGEDTSRIDIDIEYKVISSNNRRNLVYPFYMEVN